MKPIFKYIRKNWYELVTTFFIFANLYPLLFPNYFYFIGLALVFFKMMRYHVSFRSSQGVFFVFVVVIWLSTIINVALDLRLVLFTGIIFLCSPFVTSLGWHLYKKKLLRNLCIGFACTVFVSLIAKAMGVNYQVEYNMGGRSMVEYGGVDEFAGFAKFPMWNSAAAAVSIIYFAYLLFKTTSRERRKRYVCIFMVLTSFYVCLISASRAAAAFSVVASALLLFMLSRGVGKVARYVIIFGIIFSFTYPFFHDSARRMLLKQETQEASGNTSRDALWAVRAAEFNSSPVYGIGFAAHGVDTERSIGQFESGSSWYAILAQTGLIGFSIILILWVRTLLCYRRIRYDSWNILAYAFLIFFTLHSIFEGYMFQGGWYMCYICWLCVGIINEAAMYRKRLMQ